MTLLLQGDARDVLRILLDKTVNCTAMSVPYYQQRDYGVPGQIGRETTIRQYLDRLWAMFDELWRILTDDGTCFVNIGEKYKSNCAQLIPERFAIGMKKRGWILRSKLVWHKKNCKPESVKTRFTNDWEQIYFFAKTKAHYFHQQFEPYSLETLQRCDRFVKNHETFDPARHKQDKRDPSQAPFRVLERIVKSICTPGQTPNGMHIARLEGDRRDMFYKQGRNMRSVWSLPTAQYRGSHFAVWPEELVERLIRAGCPTGGVVLDAFAGSGTTLVVAEELHCEGIGIDINGDYLKLAEQRILEARAKRAST